MARSSMRKRLMLGSLIAIAASSASPRNVFADESVREAQSTEQRVEESDESWQESSAAEQRLSAHIKRRDSRSGTRR